MAEEVLADAGQPDLAGRVARFCSAISGWRRLALASLLGGLAAAALPPVHLVMGLWPAFVGLLWLLDGVRCVRTALALGWAFGFGYFLIGLYWVGIAFLVDAARYAVLIPFAVAGLAAGLALFPAGAIALVHWSRAKGLTRVLVLAASWLFTEWLRAWVLTGFPWNLIGTVWAFSDEIIQSAALFGVWGLSLVTVVIACLPALLRHRREASPARRWAPIWCSLAGLALLWGGGALRLAGAPPPGRDQVPDVVLRLVQPSIEQSLKWRADLRREHLAKIMTLTSGTGFDRVSHVIWPETAVPYDVSGSRELQAWLARAAPEGGALITGAPRRSDTKGRFEIFNSLQVITSGGELSGTYDKFHLVPFGEYVPLGEYLKITKLTDGRLDFSAGPGPRTMVAPGLPPFGPLICYEVIFPGEVVAQGAPRPSFLLSVTNDAWFGESSGPYQHLAAARLRSVEEGLPMIRAANNGISAVTDGYGRILSSLGLNEIGVIDSGLPRPVDARTIFSKTGKWTVLLLIIVFICPLFINRLLGLSAE